MRILVVEDERKVASFLRQGVQEEGHAVEGAADGAAALDLLLGEPGYDLAVLDLMLPKRDGFDVLRTLRSRHVQTPVLILTARDGVRMSTGVCTWRERRVRSTSKPSRLGSIRSRTARS